MTAFANKPESNSTNVRSAGIKFHLFQALIGLLWRASPALSMMIVRNLLFAPRRGKLRPGEAGWLEKGDPFDIVVNNRTVKCWKWGEGPGILLAHGWNGRGVQLFHFIAPLMKSGFSVMALDAPGHGASAGKTSSYFEYTDAVRHLLSSCPDLDIRGAIAHSFGGAAVVNAMHKERRELNAVLVSPALKLFGIFYGMFSASGVPVPLLQRLIADYEKRFGYDFKADEPYRLLSKISSELLIVHDRQDETIPYAHSAEACRKFQHVLLHPTSGLGHKQVVAHPATVAFICDYLHEKMLSASAEKPSEPAMRVAANAAH